tara:strand:+ start:3358 stop:4359 length:1002 start_codon:yes stop_codon:yes gene_type:complete
MSEEKKEGLIEETIKEETNEFDAAAFTATKTVDTENAEETETEEVVSESKTDSSETTSEESEDGFAWDNIKVEEETTEEETTENNEDSWNFENEEVENESEDTGTVASWETLANDLGLEVESYDQLVKAIDSAVNPVPVNDKVTQLRSYLKFTDKQIMMADFVAQGMTKEEAKQEVDNLDSVGLLKREALALKKDIRNAADAEERRLVEEQRNSEAEEIKAVEENRNQLINYLKENERFFGGKVSRKEREDIFKYVTSGGFDNDMNASHANVAQMAFLWKNHKKIFKMISNDGFEKGKSSVLDNITSPDLGRRAGARKAPKPSGFDPAQFMAK